MWPFKNKHGARCPECGSTNTRTGLEPYYSARFIWRFHYTQYNRISDIWECKDCKHVFKIQ